MTIIWTVGAAVGAIVGVYVVYVIYTFWKDVQRQLVVDQLQGEEKHWLLGTLHKVG
jgi:hypothetical protein